MGSRTFLPAGPCESEQFTYSTNTRPKVRKETAIQCPLQKLQTVGRGKEMISTLVAATMRRARHHTLIFHRVMAESDPMSPGEPTAAWFRPLMKMLASNFEMIGLDEAIARAAAGSLSGRTISVTFDDGYADNYICALPILEEFNIPATFFVASGFIDGGRMWNDSIIETYRRLEPGVCEVDLGELHRFDLSGWETRRTAAATTISAWKHLPPDERQAHVDQFTSQVTGLPADLMMTKEQLRSLAASSCSAIGGHTRGHPILASLPDSEAAAEIEAGKKDLENWIQQELEVFAYPNGKLGMDYHPKHAALVRQAGFSAAVATDWGTFDASGDCYAIPRFTPWQRNLTRFSLDLARCHFDLI